MPALHEAPAAAISSGQLTSLPILILNAHSNCNCRCVMCDIWKRKSNDQVRVQDLELHRSSLKSLNVRQVVLTGGEPLLHNDLTALCMFFREQNIHLTLLTTGLLLQKKAKEVATLFDDIIVSLDGPPEIHDAIRNVKGAYNLIGLGINEVRRHNPSALISCRTTVQKANHRHLRATVDAAKHLELNSISFLSADLTSEAFNRPLIWPGEKKSEIGLTQQEVLELEDEIEQLIVNYEESISHRYILESADKLRRIPRRFREHLGELAPQAPICNAPWVSAVIEIDGSVRPCFFHRPIGNASSMPLEDVLNSESAKRFRNSLDIETNETCRRCVCSLNYQK